MLTCYPSDIPEYITGIHSEYIPEYGIYSAHVIGDWSLISQERVTSRSKIISKNIKRKNKGADLEK